MSFAVQLFIILLLAGLFLVGAEIFVPGGILGVIGVVAVLGAVIAGFGAFGPIVGTYIAFGIVVLLGAALVVWIRVFPSTPFGRGMTVGADLKTSKGTQDGLAALVGMRGTADSTLRPSGFAILDGKRIDVITEGELIDKETPVVVARVEGNRVVVRRADA
jgi:membrane-bound serine protease (ClpP class)